MASFRRQKMCIPLFRWQYYFRKLDCGNMDREKFGFEIEFGNRLWSFDTTVWRLTRTYCNHRKSGFNEATEWKCRENYPDEMTFRLFHSYAAITQQTVEAILEQFGEFFFTYSYEQKYGLLMKCQSDSLQGFLDNLSSFHYFLEKVVFQDEAHGPTFRCEANQDGTLTLHYFSDRKSLWPMVKGLIRQASEDLFHQPIRIVVRERKQEKRRNLISEHVIFSISPVNNDDKLTKTQPKAVMLSNKNKRLNSTPNISLLSFSTAFPNHICFNKQMFIEHSGVFIQNEFEVAARRLVKISDILVLVQPEDVAISFKSFLTYLNSPFVFRAKHPLKRNEGKITRPFLLKGQIHLLNNGEHMLFMASPYFSTVHELLESNVYISDMQLNDNTRDLILLNQNRISQQELNRKLEEAAANMQHLTIELENQRKQLDLMQSDMLHPSIANQITEDNRFADEHQEVTFLHCELPHFNLINQQLEAQEVVDLMNRVFGTYDRLIDYHCCLKIHSLMDSYFVICGAPVHRPGHAAHILNLAISMIYMAHKIIVPKINLPLMLRIGVHSGSMVGMVVGNISRMHYTAVSESVNIAKKLSTYSEPGQILVTSNTKVLASKSNPDVYNFQTYSYLKLSNNNQATCTFWLEKNIPTSIAELTGIQESEEPDFDWSELERDQVAWSSYYRKHLGLYSLHEKQRSTLRWRRIKRDVKAKSEDSGYIEAISSSACSIQ